MEDYTTPPTVFQGSVSQITQFLPVPGLGFHLLVTDLDFEESRHGKRLSVRRAGEEPRPANAPKRSLWRGRHLHFYVLGGRNNQNQRGRPTKVCSRTTHYLRRNRHCSFARTDPLAGKLNTSVLGLFVFFGIGVASLLIGKRRT